MLTFWRTIVAAVAIGGSGCCHHCGCCDPWNARDDCPPLRLDEGPPPRLDGRAPLASPPPAEILPPVGPRPGTGAYGGS